MRVIPTGVPKSLLIAHTGRSNLLTASSAIELGALGTLLGVFEGDIKQLITDELEIDLN